jgi:hypothetical protein
MYFIDEYGEQFYGSVVGDKGKIICSETYETILEKDENKRADEYNTYVEKLLDTHGLTR